ncbi:MAG: hypothetical protein AB8I08_05460 [Sandaracinaceae bacterium]
MRPTLALVAVLLVSCDPSGGAPPDEPNVEPPASVETVTLRARHPDGVPLHAEEHGSGMTGRLPDGATVEVVRWGAGRRWLEVRSADGAGWITARYVGSQGSSPSPSAAPTRSGHLPDAWRSRESCARTPVPAGTGIATWNLRWFPDGGPNGPGDRATDVTWMACTIASLGVAVVAVQEVMLDGGHAAAFDRMRTALDERTGGRWEASFDSCRRDGRQHVGLLWDSRRARVSGTRTRAEVNPLGGACAGQLRPGFAASVQIGNSAPLDVTVVHLDSGVEARDLEHRRQSLAELVSGAGPRSLVLGDFNAMGCTGCGVSGDAERAEVDRAAAGAGLVRVRADVDCTEFYRGRGQTLDLALAGRGLDMSASVAGPCRTHTCSLPRGVQPPAHRTLSDHCPVVLQLR